MCLSDRTITRLSNQNDSILSDIFMMHLVTSSCVHSDWLWGTIPCGLHGDGMVMKPIS